MNDSTITDTPDYDALVVELGDPAEPLAALNEALETSPPRFAECPAMTKGQRGDE